MAKIEKNDPIVCESQIVPMLNTLYDKALSGIPKVSSSVDELADDYLQKEGTPAKAAKSLINYQIAKCGTSGFLTGLGGLITLPFTVPANISSVIYVQLRMIAAIAKIGGFDIHSDQVQTLIYACLTGSAMADVLKQTGIKAGEKIAINAVKKIPGAALVKVNQKVGFRLVTKFGETGVVKIGKMVPGIGGVIGATVDVASTKLIAENAYRLFITKKLPENKKITK